MGLPILLFVPFYVVLLLPICSFLLFLVKLLCQAILCIFWKKARTHFALWPPDSSFLVHHLRAGDLQAATKQTPLLHEKPGVCQYELGEGEQAECVFCLCGVEEGDEIRELGCLDQWIDHGRGTCPLCRGPLLPPRASGLNHADAAEEEGVPDDLTGLPFTVFIRSWLPVW